MGDFNDALLRNQNAGVQGRTKAQNRVNVLQLKMIGQSHPTGLTPTLLKLFEARPPLEYKPPPEKRKCPPYTGMAHYASLFAEPGDPEYAPPIPEVETPAQRKARIHKLRLEKGAEKAAEELEKYDPHNDPNVTADPYKTLFVSRLSYDTSESRLKREFETYGPIKRVKMIHDKLSNKPRGYAFIEYAHTRDMKAAYKQADGKKIDGRRVLVDVERGRTVPNWRPRRLGGGLGTTRVGGEDLKHSTREPQSGGPSRSEEPRARDDREREKSRERGRDREREREKSRERSHDKPRERERREDKHHKDRDRTRDKERERDHGHRDRDRTRDRDRGRDRGRDHDRPRERDRNKGKDRDYEVGEADRGHSHDRDYDYDHKDGKYDRYRHGDERGGVDDDDRGWYESEHGYKRSEAEHDDKSSYDRYGDHDKGHYEDDDRYNSYDDHGHYDQMEEDKYNYDGET